MTERLTIARLGHRGDGIADTPQGPLYVPFTLPGESAIVEAAENHPDRRHLLTVETPSAERVTPICPHFGICGGCAMQHWALPAQHAWKRQIVVAALAHEKIDAEVAPTIDAHGEGRRRATLHARQATHDVVEVGYTAARSHQVVSIDHCPILAPAMAGTIEAAWDVASALRLAQKPLDIQVTATDNGLDIDVRGSGPLSPDRAAALAKVAAKRRLARITRHGELVAQNAPPIVSVGKAKVTLPPGAFLQATAGGEAALAQLVLDHTGKAKSVADLFCGVGPFALRLAEKTRVAAFDSDAPAIAALQRGAATPGLKPVQATARDLFRRPLVPLELKDFDAVVFDPPRQGAEAQARELAKSTVPTVVAVSCDPNTFARDARILLGGDYKLTAVTPVDQFRYSPHVEVVAKFER